MHLSFLLQQSAAVVHVSYSFEQPGGLQTHTAAPASDERQKPQQHWSPVSQLVPSAWQAGSTQ